MNLRRTVGSDRRFDNLSRSHLQSKVAVGNSNECSDALVCAVIGGGKSNVIGCEDGDCGCITIRFVSEGRGRFVS